MKQMVLLLIILVAPAALFAQAQGRLVAGGTADVQQLTPLATFTDYSAMSRGELSYADLHGANPVQAETPVQSFVDYSAMYDHAIPVGEAAEATSVQTFTDFSAMDANPR
jgi:hypothetical protein